MRKLLLALLSLALSSSVGAQSCCDKYGLRKLEATANRTMLWWPPDNIYGTPNGTETSAIVLDAAGEVGHICGSMTFDDNASSKTFTGASPAAIGWLAGTTTFANAGTTFRIGIADPDTGNGPPGRSDGTADVYADLVGATDTISSATYYSTVMEVGGAKTINRGGIYCVYVSTTARAGADSVIVKLAQAGVGINFPFSTIETSGPTFTNVGGAPNFYFTFDDGSNGWFEGSVIYSSVALPAHNSGSTPDERALLFKLPCDAEANAIRLNPSYASNAANAEANIFSNPISAAPTQLTTTFSHDANLTAATGNRSFTAQFAAPVILRRGVDYAASYKPTAAVNITFPEYTVPSAGYLEAWPGGANARQATRTDGSGTFTEVTTVRPIIQVGLTKLNCN